MESKGQTAGRLHGVRRWSHLAEGSSGRSIVRIGLALIVVGSLVGIIVPAGTGWDFANFYDAGRRAASGELSTLYEAGAPIGGESAEGGMMFWGTPLSAYLYVPLASFAPGAALTIFKIANVLALFGALAMIFLSFREFAPDREAFAVSFVVAALLFQPFWTIFRVGGQSTPFAFVLLVGALLAHPRERFFLSWALFAGAVMIKPILAPGLIFLLAFSGRRAFLAAIPVGIGFLAVSLLTAGWTSHVKFLGRMSAGADTMRDWWFNSALAQPFVYLPSLVGLDPGDGPHVLYRIMLWLSAIAVIAAATRLVLTGIRHDLPARGRLHLTCLVALTLPVLIVPIAWEHYLAFLFPLFMFVLASRSRIGDAAVAVATVAVVLAVGQNLILVMAVAEAVGWDRGVIGFGLSALKSAPGWLAAWLLWKHRNELVDAHAGMSFGRAA
ncbi:MAG: glycosyltransferase family 87 protein [Gemmatimonadota bacterium]